MRNVQFLFQPSRRSYVARKRAQQVPIRVLGELGWTVAEIAKALGITPPTVRKAYAYHQLEQAGYFHRSRKVPLAEKLAETIHTLAKVNEVAELTPDGEHVREALYAVLAQVPRHPPAP